MDYADASYPYNLYQKEANPVLPISLSTLTTSKKKGLQFATDNSRQCLLLDPSPFNGPISHLTEFRQQIQVQSHLEIPRILVQLGHIQRNKKLAPQTDPKWSPTRSVTRYQAICPIRGRDGRYACQVSRAQRMHSRP